MRVRGKSTEASRKEQKPARPGLRAEESCGPSVGKDRAELGFYPRSWPEFGSSRRQNIEKRLQLSTQQGKRKELAKEQQRKTWQCLANKTSVWLQSDWPPKRGRFNFSLRQSLQAQHSHDAAPQARDPTGLTKQKGYKPTTF